MRYSHKPKRPNQSASIDGIVSDGRQLGASPHKPFKPDKIKSTPTLDAFVRRSDGFHAMRQSPHSLGQSPEAEESSLLNEPIVLDDIEPKRKRRLFGRSGVKHPRRRRAVKRFFLAFGALILLAGAYFAFKFYVTEKHLFRGGGAAPALSENIDITKLNGEGDGRINILVLGIGGPGHDGPDLTDTILLLSIDPVNHKAAMLSIPRDLCVKDPCGSTNKINAFYTYGKEAAHSKDYGTQVKSGIASLDKVLEPVIGVPIHYHVIVDFAAFKQGVDALGGITFNVPETLYDPTIAWENHRDPYIARAGIQTLHGQQALLYARSRETSSDFARAQRQRQVIVAMKEKILSLGTFSNPVKVSSLMSSFGNNVYTDFSLNDTMRLYQIMGKIPSQSIVSLDLVTPPHAYLTTGTFNGASMVVPKAGLFDYDDITSYIRNALRDSFLEKENASVAVYNATNVAGLATKKANELKSFGYTVTTVDNTPTTSNPATTTVVDLSQGKDVYTRHYLEGRFNVKAVTKMPPDIGVTPPTGTTFVIILGKDAANSSQN
jgi:LCP family protein required for cell wall assembly